MGANLKIELKGRTPEPWGEVTVEYKEGPAGCRIQADEIPGLIDEVPILALIATQAQGETVFQDSRELRLKESDRVTGPWWNSWGPWGAGLKVSGNKLIVNGPARLVPPPAPDSLGDHRIAMTLRLALILAGEDKPPSDIQIAGEECARISYPGFRDDLARLHR